MGLERITRNSSFEFRVDVEEDLNMQWQTLPMIVQPFVENSIVHGFKGRKEGNQILIRFATEEKHLAVTVKDNGIGRVPGAPIDKNHKSVGLQVVKERLGGTFGYSFKDLKDANGKALGTEVLIKLPII